MDCIWETSVDTSDIQKGVTWERACFHFLFFLFSLLDHFPFLIVVFGDSTWGKQRHMGVFLVFYPLSIWVVQIRGVSLFGFLLSSLSLSTLPLRNSEYAVTAFVLFHQSYSTSSKHESVDGTRGSSSGVGEFVS
jgi:hypothetical protein